MKKIKIYTDGACSGNPGIGGWAAVLIFNQHIKEISGYDKATTNNRMELFAVIQAILLLKEKCDLEIYSDSAYVCNAFNNNWINKWLNADWKTSSKTDVKNKDLWIALLLQLNKHTYRFVKVKGHAECEYNNRCDQLAVEAIELCRNNS